MSMAMGRTRTRAILTTTTPIPPKSDNVPLVAGDIVRLETSGGGGFGPATARPAAARAADRRMRYV
jgi:N-methylhydantoinase B